ncbi:MAG: hypothetical protein HY898_32620 [Deltaproteobacteria bacterium]|nr:hypothetical protein [Deltaproteobacteria bacterium]
MRRKLLAPFIAVVLCVACTKDYDQFDLTGGPDPDAGVGGAGGASGSGGAKATGGASGTGGTKATGGASGKAGAGGTGGVAGAGGTGGVAGSSGTGGVAGSSGTGGVAGSSGTGGVAGSSGTGGVAGSSGTGGVAGSSGTGGAAGSAGTAGAAGTAGTGGTIVTVEVRISAGNDDIEQRTTDGAMYLDSTDLELGDDMAYFGEQSVGLRFPAVAIPKDAVIAAAYVEFEVDEASNDATSVLFHGQDANNAPAFTNAAWNLTSRPTTTASVAWDNIPAWVVNAKVQSPGLAPIVQEIVNRGGWANPGAIVFVISGTGRRVAKAFETSAQAAPLLHVEYVAP